MLPRQQALWRLRGRKLIVSLLTGPSVFSGTGIACFPDSRPCGDCGDASRLRPCLPALWSFRARASHAPPTAGSAVFARPQVDCVPANGPSVFSGTGIACFPDNRLYGACGAASRLCPCYPALRSLRARASHAFPTAGPVVFPGPQVDCVPANRSFGLFGHGHRMLPRQQAMRCFRGRKSFASLLTGPSVFSGTGTGIACFPDSRPCGDCGDASRLRPCLPALWSFRARASHAPPTAGSAVFARPQVDCVPANGPSVFSGTGIACFPDNRLYGACGAASRLCPCYPALRSLRARASHAFPTAGPVVFPGPQVDCVPANRSFGLFGHGHHMLPRQPSYICILISFEPLFIYFLCIYFLQEFDLRER